MKQMKVYKVDAGNWRNGCSMIKDKNYSDDEKEVAYQMVNIKGIGNKSIFKLLEHTGSIKEAFLLPENEVYDILDTRAAKAFLRGRECRTYKTTVQLKNVKGLEFIPFTSPQYPTRLRNIPDPPFCLYVKGKLPEEDKPAVAVIGARACSEYGKAVAGYFGRTLGKDGVQIISGMARGIDGIAQRGALESGGETYAVLGCGADVCYPIENEDLYRRIPDCGGVISEYPPGTEAQSKLFPPRNRIISGLADLILVIEARKRSGTYITVLQALEQGKEVYAVPGRITDALSDGCNYLLMQGAGVAMSPEAILEELSQQIYIRNDGGYKDNEKDKISESIWKNGIINAEESKIIGADRIHSKKSMVEQEILSVVDITPIALDELFYQIKDKCQIDMSEFMLELTKLQIAGRIIGEGNYYRRSFDL